MKKIDSTVLRETVYIAVSVLVLSVAMQAVFLIIGQWSVAVLLGNLLSGITAVGNFFFMGLTVQKAVTCDEKEAASRMKLSQSLRYFAIVVLTAVGVAVPVFNTAAVIIPLFFPGIAVKLRPLFDKSLKSDVSAESNRGNS
ncbi:MAG: hypothetical protein K2M82_06635 [Lachnospiraceae bacterium]|nr:hypothetical protein [Lachnospiraceae bacterium]